MRRGGIGIWMVLLAGVPAVGGCGGHYIMTIPDQMAAAGGQAAAVVRLQRNDFFVLSPAVKKAAIRFRIGDGPLRGAYTDDLGYAATMVRVPDRPGQYRLKVAHLDIWGDEVKAEAPVFAWPTDRPVIAVDMDCLPGLWLGSSDKAARAMRRLVVGANLLYLTRRSTKRHGRAHELLRKAGYPDGPVLAWRRQYWHIVRDGRFKLPRVVVENRLVSQLADLRKTFPKLEVSVCDSALAAKAFAGAGMKVVLVGAAAAKVPAEVRRRKSWADLADRGP